MRRLTLWLLPTLLLSASAFAEAPDPAKAKRPDPGLHPWARFGVGSFARVRVLSKIGEVKQEMTGTITLLAVEGETVRVRNESVGTNAPPPSEATIPFANGALPASSQAEVVGQETLTVADKAYPCAVWRAKVEEDGKTTEVTEWWTEGVPLPLKRVLRPNGGEGESLAVATAIGVVVQVAGKGVTCVRYEATAKVNGSDMKGTTHLSAEVPGGMVRSELESKMGSSTMRVTLALVEFSAKPRDGATAPAPQTGGGTPPAPAPDPPRAAAPLTEEVRKAVQAFENEFAGRPGPIPEYSLQQVRSALEGGVDTYDALKDRIGFSGASSLKLPTGELSRDQLGTLFAQAKAAQAKAKTYLDKSNEYLSRAGEAIMNGMTNDRMEEGNREADRIKMEGQPYQILGHLYAELRDMVLGRIMEQQHSSDPKLASIAPVLIERVFGRWEPLAAGGEKGEGAGAEKPPERKPPAEDAPAEKAKKLLSRAKNYEANKMIAEAREACEKLLKEFPDTPAAVEAKAMLGRLGTPK